MAKTSEYYKSNPDAKAKRLKQQKRYNKTKKGLALRVNANRLIDNLVPTEMAITKTLLTIRGVLPRADSKVHPKTEKADSKYVNDPSTT